MKRTTQLLKTLALAGMTLASAQGLALDWKLGAHASRAGDIVTVDIPAGKAASGDVKCAYDLSPFDGKNVRATIKARGKGVHRPATKWLGFKFMLSYVNTATGTTQYPGAAQFGDDFDWRTVELFDAAGRIAPRAKGVFTLGIQDGWGRVEFDLSTFRVEEVPSFWPETNAMLRCVYTPRVTQAPRRRGVMLGHGLTEKDFRDLHDWGVTLARFQMTRGWNTPGANRDLADYDRYIDGELDTLERQLVWARKYGIKIVIDLHAAPGARDTRSNLYMFYDAKYADAFIATWRKIATRFRGRPEVYGFDLVNEPVQTALALPGCDYWSLQSRAAEAIREIDPETPIVIESNGWDGPDTFTDLRPLALPNIIYQVHMYKPMEFTHQGVFDKKAPATKYPDAAKGWNIDYLRRQLAPVVAFQKRHGARIYAGEFSAIVWGEGAENYLRDVIAVFEENGWDWTYHAFREWQGWSVEHAAPERHKMTPSADNPRKRVLLEAFRKNAQDETIDVPAGQTVKIPKGRAFTGGALVKTGAGTLDLTDAQLRNTGLEIREGAVHFDGAAHAATARYVRFTVSKTRPGKKGPPEYAESGPQYAELRLYRDGKHVPMPTGAQILGGASWSDREGPAKAIDGNVETKYYGSSPLVVDLGEEVTFDGYSYVTAHDAIGRDPMDWTLDVGDETSAFVTAGRETGFAAPTARKTEVGRIFPVRVSDVVPHDYPVTVCGAGRLVLRGARETIENLSGAGAIVLEGDSTLDIGADATFSGTVSGAGAVTWRGAGR